MRGRVRYRIVGDSAERGSTDFIRIGRGERIELPHIHVRRDAGLAKLWRPDSGELQSNGNLSRGVVRRINGMVVRSQEPFRAEGG